MRKTRFKAMYAILNFGKQEEKALLMDGKSHEAYQIEYARDRLIYFLNENPVKNVLGKIEAMTDYYIDEKGYRHYDAVNFVADELTRSLLLELKKEFI